LRGLSPTFEEFDAYRGEHTHVALSVTLHADLETPISIYRRLAAAHKPAFLLESVEGGERMSRYSFIGAGIAESLELRDGTMTHRRGPEQLSFPCDDPLGAIAQVLSATRVAPREDLPRLQGGAVGYIGFNVLRELERLPLPSDEGVGLPDLRMLIAHDVVVYDHRDHVVHVIVHVPVAGYRRSSYEAAKKRIQALVDRLMEPRAVEAPWYVGEVSDDALCSISNRSDDDFRAAVSKAQSAILDGELFQVVISRRETVEVEVEPFMLYRALRSTSPSPYMFLFEFEDFALVGASPEVLVRLEGDELLVRPIAGTRRRGADASEDLALEKDLLADEKELAEHRMLLDLGRNDLGRVAAVGSVEVEAPLHIERYSHVMHIVSDVRATLREGADAYDVFRACFPAGTVSGAPKHRACEWLATLEPDRRGPYAGAVGYFDFAGNMDTCIAIRTMIVERGKVHLQAGAGIVHDSVPELELQECINKARAAKVALRRALYRTPAEPQPREAI
jgi:anthranilate synthase component 1